MRAPRLILALLLTAATSDAVNAEGPIDRVVSLDFCADQFLLELLPRENILALSPDAEQDFSYMRESAAGLNSVRPIAEDVLTLNPGFIVRSYGGGPHAVSFFKRAGVPVIQLPYAGDIEDIRNAITVLAKNFGVPERGRELLRDFDRRLLRLQKPETSMRALYMTPTGVTGGPGTLIHEMLMAAGLENFQTLPGWRSLPLERLVYEAPDVVAAAFFDVDTNRPARWSSMRHPVARQQIREQPTASIQGAWTACGGWFLLDAIESLAMVATSGKSQ